MDKDIQEKHCRKCNINSRKCTECSITDNRVLDKITGICVCDVFFHEKNNHCEKDESSILFQMEETT